jgi:omega-6 fatty acid desaturase (delta-12 desaturase)
MIFVPRIRSEFVKRIGIAIEILTEIAEEAPICSFIIIFARQLLGWPFSLLANRTGHSYHERQLEGRGVDKKNGWGGGVNHFTSNSPLFEARDAK